jgi:hypothetical protein
METIMANKALSKRQKLTIRVEPSQNALKARNPTVPPAGQRVSARRGSGDSMPPLLQQQLLKKLKGNSGKG